MAKGVKLGTKIALDVVMFLIPVFLYKAKVLTLTYHEVAGIGILLVFLIHCLFNRRWIVNNAKSSSAGKRRRESNSATGSASR